MIQAPVTPTFSLVLRGDSFSTKCGQELSPQHRILPKSCNQTRFPKPANDAALGASNAPLSPVLLASELRKCYLFIDECGQRASGHRDWAAARAGRCRMTFSLMRRVDFTARLTIADIVAGLPGACLFVGYCLALLVQLSAPATTVHFDEQICSYQSRTIRIPFPHAKGEESKGSRPYIVNLPVAGSGRSA